MNLHVSPLEQGRMIFCLCLLFGVMSYNDGGMLHFIACQRSNAGNDRMSSQRVKFTRERGCREGHFHDWT